VSTAPLNIPLGPLQFFKTSRRHFWMNVYQRNQNHRRKKPCHGFSVFTIGAWAVPGRVLTIWAYAGLDMPSP
jgi:hypothetical protein